MDNYLLIHGGKDYKENMILSDMFILFLDSLKWLEVTHQGFGPAKRY